jgi:hypothetical protein
MLEWIVCIFMLKVLLWHFNKGWFHNNGLLDLIIDPCRTYIGENFACKSA